VLFQIFIEKAVKGEPINVCHEGYLDFTYVEDTADGIVLALTNPNAENQVYNITRGEGRKLDEAIGIIKQYFPELKVNYSKVDNPHRPIRGALDIQKQKKNLGSTQNTLWKKD